MVINSYCGQALTRIVITSHTPLHTESVSLFEPQVTYRSFVTTVDHK